MNTYPVNSISPILIPHTPDALLRYENFPSRLVTPRHVDIWLPPGYETSIGSQFPVLYMHDGQNLFLPGNSFGGEPWAVDQAIVKLMGEDKIPSVIVVGIWNLDMRRMQEYFPQKPATTSRWRIHLFRYPFLWFKRPHSDAYLRFLVSELKPFIDANYRTVPDRSHTFVMGSSMGGLISLYALTEYPQVFGGAGCLSTHWPAAGNLLVDYFSNVLPEPGAHRFYFDFGTEALDASYEPFQVRMDRVMSARGYTYGKDWTTHKFPGADHSERAWRERVHIPLEFLLNSARPPGL